MMRTDDSCRCPCHVDPDAVHFSRCCYRCEICGDDIGIDDYDRHVGRCKAAGETAAMPDRTYDCIRAEPPSDAPRFAPPSLHLDMLPASVDLRPYMPPVYDQGSLGSCTGNAWAGLVQSLRRANRPKVEDWVPSRLFIYYGERSIEGTARQDAGAAISDGAKVLTRNGVCPETTWPYEAGRFAVRPSAAAIDAARPHKIQLAESLDNRDITSLKSALALGLPIAFGFDVYQSFESRAVAVGGVLPVPKRGERQLGGHAVLAVGYDDARESFIVRNSWGAGWGQQGYFWFPYKLMTNPDFASDFWTARKAS